MLTSPSTESLLDQIHPSQKADATGNVLSVWRVIDNRVTAQTATDREKYWNAWIHYAATWKIDPFLQQCNQLNIIIVISAFTARVRTGFFGRGIQIKVPTISKALLAITMTICLVGKSYVLRETHQLQLNVVYQLLRLAPLFWQEKSY